MSKRDTSCFRCNKTHSGPQAFLITCSECKRSWHHRCHIPPISDRELIARIQATNTNDVDNGLDGWMCKKCSRGSQPVDIAPILTKSTTGQEPAAKSSGSKVLEPSMAALHSLDHQPLPKKLPAGIPVIKYKQTTGRKLTGPLRSSEDTRVSRSRKGDQTSADTAANNTPVTSKPMQPQSASESKKPQPSVEGHLEDGAVGVSIKSSAQAEKRLSPAPLALNPTPSAVAPKDVPRAGDVALDAPRNVMLHKKQPIRTESISEGGKQKASNKSSTYAADSQDLSGQHVQQSSPNSIQRSHASNPSSIVSKPTVGRASGEQTSTKQIAATPKLDAHRTSPQGQSQTQHQVKKLADTSPPLPTARTISPRPNSLGSFTTPVQRPQSGPSRLLDSRLTVADPFEPSLVAPSDNLQIPAYQMFPISDGRPEKSVEMDDDDLYGPLPEDIQLSRVQHDPQDDNVIDRTQSGILSNSLEIIPRAPVRQSAKSFNTTSIPRESSWLQVRYPRSAGDSWELLQRKKMQAATRPKSKFHARKLDTSVGTSMVEGLMNFSVDEWVQNKRRG